MASSITSILDIDLALENELWRRADLRNDLFKVKSKPFEHKILGTIFFEPSTRTRLSFQSAFQRFGGSCIGFTDIEQSRSGKSYNESIEDLGIAISNYADLVVFRVSDAKSTESLIKSISVPLISAGSGAIEHPSQALIDFYTIREKRGRLSDLNVVITGNLRERTINSFVLGIQRYSNIHLEFVCPEDSRLDPSVESQIIKNNISYYNSWGDYLKRGNPASVDVIYFEVLDNEHNQSETISPSDFYFTEEILINFKAKPIILHPFPRHGELPRALDNYKGSAYFNQMTLGTYVRGALMSYMMENDIHTM